jgi:hypothetical protein
MKDEVIKVTYSENSRELANIYFYTEEEYKQFKDSCKSMDIWQEGQLREFMYKDKCQK